MLKRFLLLFLIATDSYAQQAFDIPVEFENDSITIVDTIYPVYAEGRSFSTLNELTSALEDPIPADSLFNGSVLIYRSGYMSDKRWYLIFHNKTDYDMIRLTLPEDASAPELRAMLVTGRDKIAGVYYTVRSRIFSQADSAGYAHISGMLELWDVRNQRRLLEQEVIMHLNIIQPGNTDEVNRYRYDLQTGIQLNRKTLELSVTVQKGLQRGDAEERVKNLRMELKYDRRRKMLVRSGGSSIAY